MSVDLNNLNKIVDEQKILYINHYVKDLSLETKNNLTIQANNNINPRADINLEVSAIKLQKQNTLEEIQDFPHVYEVNIRVTVNVNFENLDNTKTTLLLLEFECAGSFYVSNKISKQDLDYQIYVKCAEQILPYARCYADQILSFSSIYDPISLKRMDINLEEMFIKGKKNRLETDSINQPIA